jgi:hypothetical protein
MGFEYLIKNIHTCHMFDLSILKLPFPVQQLHSSFLKRHNINLHTLLTFGGAYSNHIHATAAVGKYFNLRAAIMHRA